jgi:hypothetical protein
VEQRGHQVRLTLTTLSFENYRAALVWARRFEEFEHVRRGVGDRKKVLGGNLRSAGVVLIRQLNCRAF